MSEVRRGANNRVYSGRGGTSDHRGGLRSGRRGDGFKQHRVHQTIHRFSEGPGREDHYGIRMQGPTTDCDICCRKSDLFGVGTCLHPICMECGIRLRILGKNETCPKCRATIDKMCFIAYTGKGWPVDHVESKGFPHKDTDRYKVGFETEYAAKCFDNYLAHICPICKKKGEPREFATFASLNQHVYMVHRFQYCDICVEHLDLLSHERRVYSQLDLERHLNKGDVDDTSQKGHPQCLFCEKRFLDEEHRYKHLRKEHFFCQICDADGHSNYFFPEHRDLIGHYKKKHVVCEEGECKQLGIAFRSEMELKMHKSTQHGVGRQTLNLDFHYERGGRGGTGMNAGGRGGFRRGAPIQRNLPRVGVVPNENISEPPRPPDSVDVKIVPSMQAQGAEVSLRYARAPNFKIQGNDFPRLGTTSKQTIKGLNLEEPSNNPSSSSSQQKKGSEKAATLNGAPAASTSWFIDDDEAFCSASRLVARQQQPNTASTGVVESPTQAASEESSSKPSYSAMFRRPNSLSNIAAKLRSDRLSDLNASDAFPSLKPDTSAIKNLPASSAWRKNTLQFREKPQIVGCIVPKKAGESHMIGKPVPQGEWRTASAKRLPEPDIWPQQNIPSSWEEREDVAVEDKIQKAKPVDAAPLIVKTEAKNKKKRGKKEKAKSLRQQKEETASDTLGEDEKASQTEDSTKEDSDLENHLPMVFSDVNELDAHPLSKPMANNVDAGGVSFVLETDSLPSKDEGSSEKPASSFSEMLSSTFVSLLDGFSKLAQSNGELTPHASSRMKNVVPDDPKDRTSPDNESAQSLSSVPPPPGLVPDTPPGLIPPPGFGPPPGFDATSTSYAAS